MVQYEEGDDPYTYEGVTLPFMAQKLYNRYQSRGMPYRVWALKDNKEIDLGLNIKVTLAPIIG